MSSLSHSLYRRMTETPTVRLLLEFTGPSVIALLSHALYNVVGRIFVGRFVGANGLAALTVAFPIMIAQFAFVLMIGGGASTLISIRLGQSRPDQAEEILGNMLVMLLTVSALLTVAGLVFLDPLLTLFGVQPQLHPFSADYLGIIPWGTPLMMVGIAMDFVIRAEGYPKTAALIMITSSITNVILGY
ncbi:MAG: MATE family efflux transporter, partial [Deltaproteobacteria bacterium]|nr:MATE family efflux transporter [Deltaproteobacteria bacterium]